jgi:hypothetical protein
MRVDTKNQVSKHLRALYSSRARLDRLDGHSAHAALMACVKHVEEVLNAES